MPEEIMSIAIYENDLKLLAYFQCFRGEFILS
jgi:hypothetical protein